jgi:DNA invertase Pin-like site-specific DNA recombinase
MEDVGAGLVDTVVVYKVDRLSRSLLDFARVMEVFNDKGVAFVSVTQNFSTADAIGRLTLNMLMSFAEFEREMIAERTRDKISAARRKGKWTGGMVPMGYVVVDHRLTVHKEEAEVVRALFANYLEGRSAVNLAQGLNDKGVPLKTQVVPRERPWTKDLVLRILRNRIYLGVVHSQGEHYPGEHAALIDPVTFEQVQALLAPKNRAQHWSSRNPSYLVRGTLKCGACGSVMTTASTHRNGRVYRYYRCVTRGKQGNRACITRQLPAEAIEVFVVEQLRAAIRQERISTAIAAKTQGHLEAIRDRLQAEQRRILEGDSSDAKAMNRLLEVDRSLARLESHLQEAVWLAQTLMNFDSLWDAFTPRNRQRLVRALVEEVIVDERAGEVTVKLANLEQRMEAYVGIAG